MISHFAADIGLGKRMLDNAAKLMSTVNLLGNACLCTVASRLQGPQQEEVRQLLLLQNSKSLQKLIGMLRMILHQRDLQFHCRCNQEDL